MVLVRPTGIKAEGKIKVASIPAGANLAALTLAEVNAAAGVELSGYVIGGTFSPTADQATGEDRRLSDTETYEEVGRVRRSFDSIRYVYSPQDLLTAAINKAYATLAEGALQLLVVRYGILATTDWATGDNYKVTPVQWGAQLETPIGDNDEFAKLTITQKPYVIGATVPGTLVAA